MEAMNEITIGWERGDKFAEVDLPSNHRLNNRLQKLHEAYPDEFQRFILNKDGTLYAKVPVKWIQIRRTTAPVYSFTAEDTRKGQELGLKKMQRRGETPLHVEGENPNSIGQM